jgi:hypothetical protein
LKQCNLGLRPVKIEMFMFGSVDDHPIPGQFTIIRAR